jgi:hypothetical protein
VTEGSAARLIGVLMCKLRWAHHCDRLLEVPDDEHPDHEHPGRPILG